MQGRTVVVKSGWQQIWLRSLQAGIVFIGLFPARFEQRVAEAWCRNERGLIVVNADLILPMSKPTSAFPFSRTVFASCRTTWCTAPGWACHRLH
eukprot:9000175-Alexandrium_andersonii.AAC.1